MDEEAEIVVLNAKINILKQKGPKKQEEKPRKMIRDHQCQMTKRKKKTRQKEGRFSLEKTLPQPKETNCGRQRILLVPSPPKQDDERVGTTGPT